MSCKFRSAVFEAALTYPSSWAQVFCMCSVLSESLFFCDLLIESAACSKEKAYGLADSQPNNHTLDLVVDSPLLLLNNLVIPFHDVGLIDTHIVYPVIPRWRRLSCSCWSDEVSKGSLCIKLTVHKDLSLVFCQIPGVQETNIREFLRMHWDFTLCKAWRKHISLGTSKWVDWLTCASSTPFNWKAGSCHAWLPSVLSVEVQAAENKAKNTVRLAPVLQHSDGHVECLYASA